MDIIAPLFNNWTTLERGCERELMQGMSISMQISYNFKIQKKNHHFYQNLEFISLLQCNIYWANLEENFFNAKKLLGAFRKKKHLPRHLRENNYYPLIESKNKT